MIRFHFSRCKQLYFLPACIAAILSLTGCGNLVDITGRLLTDPSASSVSEPAEIPQTQPQTQAPPALSDITPDSSAPASSYTATQEPLYASYSFFLPELSAAQYSNFTALYQGILAFQESIPLPVAATSQEVKDLMALLSNECPELMHLDNVWSQRSNLLGSVTTVSPSYTMDPETYRTKRGAVETLLARFSSALADADSYQSELEIFDYLISNCSYSTTAEDCGNAYGALIGGQAKCDGRAEAMVWALRSLGITSSVLTGSDHAWVTAKIDGYVFNVDPTYDDNENGTTQYPCSYAHFNVPQSAIATDPYPVDELYERLGYPSTVQWNSNYHVQTGAWVPAGSDGADLFRSQLAIAGATGTGTINIRFERAEDYKAAAAAYGGWIQTYLDENHLSCNATTYDCSEFNIIFMQLTFTPTQP
ncbi:MAG: hypothetical protein IJ468_04740 [Lachnospiraceae bacterium]|nr:hypothetical protein [Lachnospiraceae bacterium]